MISKQQRGMTMWSTAFVVGVAVFFLFLFFKLLPPYLEDLKIRTAIDGLAAEPGVGTMPKTEVVSRLEKRFDIDNVTNVKSNQLAIETRGKAKYMVLSYEVVVPMAYNVSALLEFDHARQLAEDQ
jgi:Domain of unknown function (DUF4845)